jgi:hypothetical protein
MAVVTFQVCDHVVAAKEEVFTAKTPRTPRRRGNVECWILNVG